MNTYKTNNTNNYCIFIHLVFSFIMVDCKTVLMFVNFYLIIISYYTCFARLQDYKETSHLAVIPSADSPFWGVCSKSLIATSASHVTLALAAPRAGIGTDFIWTLTDLLGAITVMDAHTVKIDGRQVIALIVKDRETLNGLLKQNPSLWWSLAYYVISIPSLDKNYYKVICRALWDRYRVRNIVLVVESGDSTVATYNPFVDESKGGLLSVFKATEFSFVVEDYNTVLNLHKLPVRITLYQSVPTAILDSNGVYHGYDGMIMRTAAEKMNFTPIISRPRDGKFFGSRLEDGKYTGSLRDIIEEKTDIAFNGQFIQDLQSDRLDFTTYVAQDDVCFIVPKKGSMPRVITIFNCFLPNVWFYTILSYIIFTVTYYFWQNICNKNLPSHHQTDASTAFLETLKMFLVFAPKPLPNLDSGKILIVSFLFMSFIIINEFQGTFLTFLNRPVNYKDINTLEELEESGLSIRTSFSKIENTLGQDPSLSGIVRNIEIVDFTERNSSVATSGALTQKQGSAGMLRVDAYKSKYLRDFVKANSSEPLHIVKECPLSYFVAYFVPRGSPLLDSFNKIIAYCVTTGLVTKWSWDSNSATLYEMQPLKKRSGQDDDGYKSFSLSDLQFSFLFYIGGIGISIIIFLFELFFYQFQNNINQFSSRVRRGNEYPSIYLNEFPNNIKQSHLIK